MGIMRVFKIFFLLLFVSVFGFSQDLNQNSKSSSVIEFIEHKVKRKQTLFTISNLYDVPIDLIKKYNPSIKGDKISKKMVLKIPFITTVVLEESIKKLVEEVLLSTKTNQNLFDSIPKKKSIKFGFIAPFNLNKIDTYGIAIGGSLGSSKEEMYRVVNFTASKLGHKHPIHLLGIGDPRDIWSLVKSGVDTFDCVSPTRLARHGSALTKGKVGKINIKNKKYANQMSPIDETCNCPTCSNYTLAYIHHLFKAGELLGLQLVTAHNIFFMNKLMSDIRKSIENDNLELAEKEWLS